MNSVPWVAGAEGAVESVYWAPSAANTEEGSVLGSQCCQTNDNIFSFPSFPPHINFQGHSATKQISCVWTFCFFLPPILLLHPMSFFLSFFPSFFLSFFLSYLPSFFLTFSLTSFSFLSFLIIFPYRVPFFLPSNSFFCFFPFFFLPSPLLSFFYLIFLYFLSFSLPFFLSYLTPLPPSIISFYARCKTIDHHTPKWLFSNLTSSCTRMSHLILGRPTGLSPSNMNVYPCYRPRSNAICSTVWNALTGNAFAWWWWLLLLLFQWIL
jgi:hypothetical protein